MAALRNIGGANEERKFRNSLNTFLVPRHKLWLMPTVRVPFSNAVNIGERKLGRKVNFTPGKIPLRAPQKCIYNISFQETAKHHAKFG